MSRIARVSATIIGLVLVFATVFLIWPTALGGKATWTIVAGSSMEPVWHTGDLVLAYDTDNWGVGDVVIYGIDSPGGRAQTIHRIIAGNKTDGWELQGDNKDTPDAFIVQDEDVLGEELFSVGKVGNALLTLKSPIIIISMVALAGGVLVYLLLGVGSSDTPRKRDDEPALASQDADA